MTYRSQEEISYDLLKGIADAQEPIPRWDLAIRTYSNPQEIRKHCQDMIEKELITNNKTNRFTITEKGLKYMKLFCQIRQFVPQLLVSR
jgi:predicted transcriptional regulator